MGCEILVLNKKIGWKCWFVYCFSDGNIVFDEYECLDDLDLIIFIGLGLMWLFCFMIIVFGEEE